MSMNANMLKRMAEQAERDSLPKSKFRMCITTMKKTTGEDGKEGYVVVGSKWVQGNGAKFRRDYFESKENGEALSVEVVNEKPEKFKINQLYMLRTRDVIWCWVEENEEND